jgi:hypothetical protein
MQTNSHKTAKKGKRKLAEALWFILRPTIQIFFILGHFYLWQQTVINRKRRA